MAQYKILLVDDEVDVRESIARTVDWEACGFSLCGCAAGALEALEMAKDLVPDVVMTDICMPYMDGLELIERLQQMYPAMRFVVVSGHDDFAYAQRAMQFRVMDYLLKPLSLTGVREALARIRASLDEAFARRLDEAAFLEQRRQDRVQIGRLRLLEMLFENTNESLGLLPTRRRTRPPSPRTWRWSPSGARRKTSRCCAGALPGAWTFCAFPCRRSCRSGWASLPLAPASATGGGSFCCCTAGRSRPSPCSRRSWTRCACTSSSRPRRC